MKQKILQREITLLLLKEQDHKQEQKQRKDSRRMQ